jgi:hypothetical protein
MGTIGRMPAAAAARVAAYLSRECGATGPIVLASLAALGITLLMVAVMGAFGALCDALGGC